MIPTHARPLARRAIDKAARATVGAIFRSWRKGGAPLAVLAAARRLFPVRNALASACRPSRTSGRELHDPHLAALLADTPFGGWRLSVDTVDFLESVVRERRPERVLEFGSGVSTACLAHVLRELHGDEEVRLVSIEQDEGYADETRRLLAKVGVSGSVRLEVRRLVAGIVDGTATTTYDLPAEFLREVTSGTPPTLVVVDGPSGGVGRYDALRLAQPYLGGGTTVVLDDALRDAELGAASRWHRAGVTTAERILPIGKGLLVAGVNSAPP